ncbi:putative splicing factor, arginine/serine-rich 7, partial [Armadillidium nasatum]
RDVAIPVQSRICFIKFQERDTVGVAQHLTNTVFIDRALVVIPFSNGEMPDEKMAMDILNMNGLVPGLATDAKWPPHIDGIILRTIDPYLTENGLPDYPNLPATTESYKVNEIRRTVIFDNIPAIATTEEILAFAEQAGQVKYLRVGTELNGTKNCLVEYTEQSYIIGALKLRNTEFMGSTIKVNHSTVAIIKPQTKSNEAAQREIEEALRRVKEAQNSLLSSNMDPLAFLEAATKDKFSPSRSRSRSRSRHSRSRSKRSRSRRSRSRRSRSRSRRKNQEDTDLAVERGQNQRQGNQDQDLGQEGNRGRNLALESPRSKSKTRSSRKEKEREKEKERSSKDKKERKEKESRSELKNETREEEKKESVEEEEKEIKEEEEEKKNGVEEEEEEEKEIEKPKEKEKEKKEKKEKIHIQEFHVSLVLTDN